MPTKLKAWMAAATTVQQEQLAKLARTSRRTLYQLSNASRNASAAKAILLEHAARRVRGAAALPIVRRGDLCEACSKCEYARRCLAADEEVAR